MLKCIFFVGAGASVPFGIPTMTQMVADFEAKTSEPHYGLGYVVQEIKNRLKHYTSFDIEALITVLIDIVDYDTTPRRILNHPSLHFFSPYDHSTLASHIESLGKQYWNEAKQILEDVRGFVVDSCRIREFPFQVYAEFFKNAMGKHDANYAERLRSGRKDMANHVFTTNYDQVLEAYCSHEELNYESGEIRGGILKIDSGNRTLYDWDVNAHKIYKLHGSINWYSDEHGVMRWVSEPIRTGERTSFGHKMEKELLIYPAFSKYTFREPFYAMFHHLKQGLVSCNHCYVVGYSFRDDDILGLFHDAMMINKELTITLIDPMAEVIARERFPKYVDRIKRIPETLTLELAQQIGSK